MGDRRVEWLGAVGVIALLLGGYVTVVAVPGDHGTAEAATPVRTTAFTSRAGGFSVQVPRGMHTARRGAAVRFTTADRHVVVTVGRSSRGTVAATSGALVRQLRASYPTVRVLGHTPARVDDRASRMTYGQAVTSQHVGLRYALLVVPATPRNYAIAVFAAASSDPDRVLPVVDRLAGSFHVTARKR